MSVKRYHVDVYPYNIQEGDNTIVNTTIFVYDQNDNLVYEASFSASSTRNPVDKPNSKAGILIALGRAFSKAGKRMEEVGNSYNKHDEDIRAERAKQSLKPTPKEVEELTPIIEKKLDEKFGDPSGVVYD